MKISLFIAGLGNGGAERVFLRLLESFSDAGHDVEIVSATNKGALKHDSNVKYLGANFGYLSCFKYYKYLKNRNPDVVIATLSSSIFTASFVKFFLFNKKHKLICRIANVYQEPKTYLAKLTLWLQRFSLINCNGVIFNSKATMSSASHILNIDFVNTKTIVINNPVLNDSYQSDKKLIKDKILNSNNVLKTIVFIGRLVPQKRVDHAIKIFSNVVKKIPNSRLVIIGDGPEKNKAIALINKCDIYNQVSIFEYCSNVPKLLIESDCIINTSEFEGFGNVFIEGLAYCDNLVSYRSVGGASELLPCTNAVLISDGDVEGMSEAVIDILKHRRVARLATNKYLDSFTASHVGNEYLEFSKHICTK